MERDFERLYRESYSTVYGWVRVRMSSDEDAQDVVSEAFLNAARAFGSFDPSRAKFSTWVTTIARNCMISHFRKERPAVALEDVPQSTCAVEGGQSAVDDRDFAYQLLALLDDTERALVLLKYREGLRNIDISRSLGMNPSTVSTKLSKSLVKMRDAAHAVI